MYQMKTAEEDHVIWLKVSEKKLQLVDREFSASWLILQVSVTVHGGMNGIVPMDIPMFGVLMMIEDVNSLTGIYLGWDLVTVKAIAHNSKTQLLDESPISSSK